MSNWLQFLDRQDNIVDRLVDQGASVDILLDQEELLQVWKMQGQKLLD
jgi:hypothetical protein